ncbi:MAG: S9 family peptidase [Bacteroidia bacterium]|nr:S9 family peptidase [Bacteroidales bacterium]NCD41009.1 S9 family peptidase [Bacteroidia bacterium]
MKIKSSFLAVALALFVVAPVFSQQQKITLEDLWRTYSFYPSSVRGVASMNDGAHYTTLEQRGSLIVRYDYASGEPVDTLFRASDFTGLKSISGYTFSSDEKMLLVYNAVSPLYRHSFTASWYVINLEAHLLMPLPGGELNQLATFSPSADKVAYVRKNNLYYYDLIAGKEVAITTDGEVNHIINGAPDWVYEEEFGFSKAFTWSADGRYLAWMRFDESSVKQFEMTLFQGQAPALDENALYPSPYTFKYPKAGEDNSLVSVHIFSLIDGTIRNVDLGPETDQYIPRIQWTHDLHTMAVFRVNRHQNNWEILFADAKTGETQVIYTEVNDWYIEESNYDNVLFLDDNEHFMLTSEKDGWMHLYNYNFRTGFLQQITKGEWEVTDFLGYDPDTKTVFYISTETSPMQRDLFSVRIDGKKRSRITTGKGTNRAVFSKGYKYFINYFSNAETPPLVTLHDRKGKQIRVLEDNQAYKEKIGKVAYTTKEFFTFTTSAGIGLNGWMLKPVDFDPNRQYPCLMTQYSGPGSQEVLDSWSFDWYNYLAQEGYLVACVDGRGTGGRGEAFKKSTYLQLGRYESDDQIEAAKWLSRHPNVDADNIGIWGWSFGGFMVALCMEKGEGIFDAGISVAPVTNWRYYDNIYTERFMRTPQENPEGYDENSPLFHAADLEGSLLIVHGSADDNVHVQNTMEFTERLVQADKQFEMMIYTNRNHGIFGGNTRYHLYKKFTGFLNEKLKDGE